MRAVVLEHHDVLGTLCYVEAGLATDLHWLLANGETRFGAVSVEAQTLARTGRSLFILAKAPAYWVADTLLEGGWLIEFGQNVRPVEDSYSDPVENLFRLGHPRDYRNWRNYRTVGIGPQHTMELLLIQNCLPAIWVGRLYGLLRMPGGL